MGKVFSKNENSQNNGNTPDTSGQNIETENLVNQNIENIKEENQLNQSNGIPNNYSSNISNSESSSNDFHLIAQKHPRQYLDEENIPNKKKKITETETEIKPALETLTQINIKKDKLKKEISEMQKKLSELERIEQIKKDLNKTIRNTLFIEEKNENKNIEKIDREQIGNKIEEIMNKYWIENEQKLKPFYQSMNQQNKNYVRNEINALKALNEKTYLKTILIKNKNKEKNNINNCNYQIPNDLGNEDINITNDNKKIEEKNEVNVNNKINKNNIKINKIDNYSFKCLTENLNFFLLKGTKEANFMLELENDGTIPWPKDKTFLIKFSSKDSYKSQNIPLTPLNPGSKCFINILFKNMDKLMPGKYKTYFAFNVGGKNYGNNIKICIKIIEETDNSEINFANGSFKN